MSKDNKKMIIGEHGSKLLNRFSPKNEALKRLLGKGAPMVVVDKEDEYAALAKSIGGEVITLSPGSDKSFNLFESEPAMQETVTFMVTGPGREEFIEKMQKIAPSMISDIEKKSDHIIFKTVSVPVSSLKEMNDIIKEYMECLHSVQSAFTIEKIA